MERQYVEYTVRKSTSRVGVLFNPLSVQDAYMIGRIAADGSYTYNHAKRFARMGLTAKDVPFLEAMVREYFPSTHVLSRDGRNIKINNGRKDYHYVTSGHGEVHFPIGFTRQLEHHGIVKHKAERVIAGVPDAVFSAAVLGFLDGDGSVVVRHRKDYRTPRLNVHFVSSCRMILIHVQRHLERRLGIASSLYERKGQACSELRINDTAASIRFCEWVYSQLPSFYCTKKKQVFDRYMSCVRSGENGEGRKDNPVPSRFIAEGVETTGVPEVAKAFGETAPDAD